MKKDHAQRYLRAIHKKYKSYFKENNLRVEDCVRFLVEDDTVNVYIIKQDLPLEIKNDIELMFWL